MSTSSLPFRVLSGEIANALAVAEAADDHADAARLYGKRSPEARAACLRYVEALLVPGAREAYAKLQASAAASLTRI